MEKNRKKNMADKRGRKEKAKADALDQWTEETDTNITQTEPPKQDEGSDDEYRELEKSRLEDLRDRDAYADRLKERDRERTKKLVGEKANEKAEAEALKRKNLADDKEARRVVLPDVKERSRQEYLKKRELQQTEKLQIMLESKNCLFIYLFIL